MLDDVCMGTLHGAKAIDMLSVPIADLQSLIFIINLPPHQPPGVDIVDMVPQKPRKQNLTHDQDFRTIFGIGSSDGTLTVRQAILSPGLLQQESEICSVRPVYE